MCFYFDIFEGFHDSDVVWEKKIACDKKKRMRFYIIFSESISVISSHAGFFFHMRLLKHACEIHIVDISTQKTHFLYFHM